MVVVASLTLSCGNSDGDANSQHTMKLGSEFPPLPAALQMADCEACGQMAMVPETSCSIGSDLDEVGRWEGREEPKFEAHVKSFLLARTEVTQAQWMAVMGDVNPKKNMGTVAATKAFLRRALSGFAPYNPSAFKECGLACPVESVSWDDAQLFIQRLNKRTGSKFRLPTDVEWECAARGGGKGRFGDSDDMDGNRANYDSSISYDGKPTGPFRRMPVRADSFAPNPYGLYNIRGNVWEWAQDCWTLGLAGHPADGSARLTGDCTERSLRGGSWIDDARRLRPAHRSRDKTTSIEFYQGFRLAHDLP